MTGIYFHQERNRGKDTARAPPRFFEDDQINFKFMIFFCSVINVATMTTNK